jgi:hypothetical protein
MALSMRQRIISVISHCIFTNKDSFAYGLKMLQSALMFDREETGDHQSRAPVVADDGNMYRAHRS